MMSLAMAGIRSWELGVRNSQKFLPAMFAAKIIRLPVTFGAQGGRFIHCHATNRVGCHNPPVFTTYTSPSNIWTFTNIVNQRVNFL
jgi:hypothetical protein